MVSQPHLLSLTKKKNRREEKEYVVVVVGVHAYSKYIFIYSTRAFVWSLSMCARVESFARLTHLKHPTQELTLRARWLWLLLQLDYACECIVFVVVVLRVSVRFALLGTEHTRRGCGWYSGGAVTKGGDRCGEPTRRGATEHLKSLCSRTTNVNNNTERPRIR